MSPWRGYRVAGMSDATTARERWNERYAGDGFEPLPDAPAPWLVEHADALRELLAATGEARALDVACGDGRNARWLAELGFAVDAVDVSDVAIGALRDAVAERGLRVDARVLDLEREPLPAGAYDVVVCVSYLQRDLFAALRDALRPGGLVLYETFARAHVEELGPDVQPGLRPRSQRAARGVLRAPRAPLPRGCRRASRRASAASRASSRSGSSSAAPCARPTSC